MQELNPVYARDSEGEGIAVIYSSINQRAVLSHRADTVAKLHADELHFIVKPQA